MSSVFYDKLINIHDLHLEFDRLDLPITHRNELMQLVDSSVHHEVFDLIMVELPEEHRSYFLEVFSTDPADPALLEFLTAKVPGISDKITARANEVRESFAEEVRKLP